MSKTESMVRQYIHRYNDSLRAIFETGLIERNRNKLVSHQTLYSLRRTRYFIYPEEFSTKIDYFNSNKIPLVWVEHIVPGKSKKVKFSEVFESCPDDLKKKLAFHMDVFNF